MPSSAVRTFTHADDYASSIRAVHAALTITGRGRFGAKLIRIDLHDLWMQRLTENLPRVMHVTDIARRAIFLFRIRSGPSSRLDGMEIGESNIVRFSDADTAFLRSEGSSHLGAMSLPLGVLSTVRTQMAGCDLTIPKDVLSLTPLPGALARLKRLHAVAGSLAVEAPLVLAHAEAARGLEQALIEAMIDCLATGDVREDRAAARHHVLIMRRFHGAIERRLEEPFYVPELCKEIGVSDRTLRICCQEQLGMSPKQYLLLRRMHLVRKALRRSSGSGATVTEIALRYGFWQFGWFAGRYKMIFGELPSATLAGPT